MFWGYAQHALHPHLYLQTDLCSLGSFFHVCILLRMCPGRAWGCSELQVMSQGTGLGHGKVHQWGFSFSTMLTLSKSQEVFHIQCISQPVSLLRPHCPPFAAKSRGTHNVSMMNLWEKSSDPWAGAYFGNTVIKKSTHEPRRIRDS